MRGIGDGVVDLIASVSHVPKYRIWLLHEVDLETDVIDDVRTVPGNGNDCDEVNEWNASTTIIDE